MKTRDLITEFSLDSLLDWKEMGMLYVGNYDGSLTFGATYNKHLNDIPIDEAIEIAKKPLTVSEALNLMSAEEKARFWVGKGTEIHNQACHYAYASETKKKSWDECYVEKMTEFFNSP